MPPATALRATRVLADGGVAEDAWVVLEQDRIVAVADAPVGAAAVDLGDVDLIPGLVDLHSDCLEARARPRPTSPLPLEDALLDLDAEVAVQGITTHYCCVALHSDHGKHRSLDRARETVAVIDRLSPELRVDHRIHLRVELLDEGVGIADELAAVPAVGLVSYMDHTPGQGQYRDEAQLLRHFAEEVPEGLRARLADRRARSDQLEGDRERVAAAAAAGGALLASHDDDRRTHVEEAKRLGARISEFPVTLEAAQAARDLGLGTVMGAPNARRGGSHVENLSAHEALAAGVLDALASDYHPASLLASAYALADQGHCSWEQAVALVTSGPARIAQLHDRGRVAPGLRADLVAVARRAGRPVVEQVWRGGRPVFAAQARG